MILLCLEVLCRLAGVACSATERTDRRTLSMACLPLLSLPDCVNPLAVSARGDEERDGDEASSIRPFTVRGLGPSTNKDSDSTALGAGVCSALGDVINQALLLMFPPEDRRREEGRREECSLEEKGLGCDEAGTVGDVVGTESMGTDCRKALKSRDVAASMLMSGCMAVECLVMSDRSHRWLMAEAGVSRDLVAALRLTAEETVRLDHQSSLALMTALCLAVGSLARDSEGSTHASQDSLSQALPVLCSVLDLCAEQGSSELAVGDDTKGAAGAELATSDTNATTMLSAAASRAIAYIVAGESHQSMRARGSGIRSKGNARDVRDVRDARDARDARADSGTDIEGSLLRVLQRHSYSLSTSLQVCLAVAELALRSVESAEKFRALGVPALLMSVIAKHPAASPSTTLSSSHAVGHESEVFCMMWCRALYALLKALGASFFIPSTDSGDRGDSGDSGLCSLPTSEEPSKESVSKASLAQLLLDMASLEGTSAALAGSVSMALSAVVSVPSPYSTPSAQCLEVTLLEKLAGTIFLKHQGQGDWFSFSLQQAASSISFSKPSSSAKSHMSPTHSASAVSAAASGGIIYWGSVFLFHLLAPRHSRALSARDPLSPALSLPLLLR